MHRQHQGAEFYSQAPPGPLSERFSEPPTGYNQTVPYVVTGAHWRCREPSAAHTAASSDSSQEITSGKWEGVVSASPPSSPPGLPRAPVCPLPTVTVLAPLRSPESRLFLPPPAVLGPSPRRRALKTSGRGVPGQTAGEGSREQPILSCRHPRPFSISFYSHMPGFSAPEMCSALPHRALWRPHRDYALFYSHSVRRVPALSSPLAGNQMVQCQAVSPANS
ncbi:uncharacterized protein LOC133080738 [Eubalaena glacialis]|uniref:uncharacterized protein LOC133080738 n=1 Tax=Eubalaena glacialis TaxID=27606 RepID=UPI002A5A83BD|nr:uncharacterized protein LOC133080738 [Eubalaena glacialis]